MKSQGGEGDEKKTTESGSLILWFIVRKAFASMDAAGK